MAGARELRKTLTVWRGAAVMLNIVLGAGLLTLPGLAVKQVGQAALLSWVLCAVASLPLLAVFTILGRRFPDAGGVPHFAERAFGRVPYVVGSFIFLAP
jgi:amino acid efflux transporter